MRRAGKMWAARAVGAAMAIAVLAAMPAQADSIFGFRQGPTGAGMTADDFRRSACTMPDMGPEEVQACVAAGYRAPDYKPRTPAALKPPEDAAWQ